MKNAGGFMSKKSIAKAIGLKSTFKIKDDDYLMTSFGKGNKALEEKYIENFSVKDLHDTFEAAVDNKSIASIKKEKIGETRVQLPDKDRNQLQAKSVIEKLFFGQAFNDNIHIQIAYNVMDIKKLFSVYANNIIYTVNNLLRMDNDKDFIGTLGTMNDLSKLQAAYSIIETDLIVKNERGFYRKYKGGPYNFNVSALNNEQSRKKLSYIIKKAGYSSNYKGKIEFSDLSDAIEKTLGFTEYKYIESAAESYEPIKNMGLDKCANYFSDVFADKDGNINLDYIYECLRLLGTMRQTAFHSDDFKDEANRISNTYTLFEIDDKATKETRTVLNAITKNKIETINNNFVNTSTVNLNILFSAYPETYKKELIKNYYDFAVRKAHKNIGFSVKTLREVILAEETELKRLNEKEYDSVRQKLYSLLDFAIYTYYLNNNKASLEFIDLLRQLTVAKDEEISLEEKKLILYESEAKRLWNNIETIVLNKVIPGIDKCKSNGGIKSLSTEIDDDLKSEILSAIRNSSKLSYFSEAIYCICAFLDGKEINMFLDSMINSFDNILSLIEIAKYADIDVKFSDNYGFFNNCEKYADELRFVKSVARMNKGKKATKDSNVHIKSFQYYDAAAIFGETDKNRVTTLFKLDERSTKDYKVDHTLRNFFINNVVNSNRYNYVVRFINTTNARVIMKNEAIVSYAISDIDDKQIIRYCESTQIPYNTKNPDLAEMRASLAEKLLKVDFDTFAKVSNNSVEAIEKERLKSLVGLYLTIIYLITKSLVRINTSYSIAFSIFERDCIIMDKKAKDEDDPDKRKLIENIAFDNYRNRTPKKDDNYFGLTEYFIREGRVNERIQNNIFGGHKYVKKDGKEITCKKYFERHYRNKTFRLYRNNVEHLNVISQLPNYINEIEKVLSYFDLYQYLMFRILEDNGALKEQNYTVEELCNVHKHQTAWQQFLYGILAPFAYSPSRYINLACKNKFIEGYGK